MAVKSVIVWPLKFIISLTSGLTHKILGTNISIFCRCDSDGEKILNN